MTGRPQSNMDAGVEIYLSALRRIAFGEVCARDVALDALHGGGFASMASSPSAEPPRDIADWLLRGFYDIETPCYPPLVDKEAS